MKYYLLLFGLLQWIFIAEGQELVEEIGSGVGGNSTTTPIVSTTPIVETTTRRARDVVDLFMPIPTNFKVVSTTSNSVTLSFDQPTDYQTDPRYTHFRVEYSRARSSKQFKPREILKTSDPNVLILNLQPGALYEFMIRTQGRNFQNNFRVSTPSETIKARTNPPSILNFKVQQVISNKENVIVSWDGLPTSFTGPVYDKFILNYYDINTPENATNIVIERQSSVILTKAPTNITHIAEKLSLGSSYNFSVYTESSGDGLTTKSDVVFVVYKLKIPGPLNLKKKDFTETSILVSFDENLFVSNIKQHRLSFVEVNSGKNLTQVDLSKDELEYNITSLQPGAIYLIKVYHLIDTTDTENITESATIYARTKPTAPKSVVINSVGTTSIEVGIEVELDHLYSNLLLQYEFVEKQLLSDEVSYAAGTTEITINNLVPGGLYNIILTYESSTGLNFDVTNASANIQARTIPYPPANLVASSRQGKIILNWNKPIGINRPISWSYEIQYSPLNDVSQRPLRISLWNRDGASKMFHSLDNIIPGTSYEVVIYTVAGESGSEFQSRSLSSKQLTVFSQPQNPRLDEWVQVSLKLIRLLFTPPRTDASNFDYFLLNVTRIQSSGLAVEYYPEKYSYKVLKNESSKLMKLTPGAVYRVVLTTVVGNDETWLQSVVNSTNSKVYKMWSPYDSHLTFARLQWDFSTCTKFGREGPNQILCNNAYENTNLNKLVVVQEGIQHWTVPMDGLYRIIGAGAGYEAQGGLGASVSGIYHLKEGSQLKIAVGQRGFSNNMAQGGAGGTFVIADDNNEENEPLLVAGGAGSCKDGLNPNTITNGRLDHSGADASLSGPRFGKGGQGELAEPGLKGSLNTAGGAGYRGVSESFVLLGDISLPATGYLPYGIEGQNFNDTDGRQYKRLLGGKYTGIDRSYSEGGFGGGGNGYTDASGGGGGYSGGGGGPINGYSGGGGSYIKFTGGMQYAEVENNGDGFVKIVLVGLPVSSPVPLTLYLVVAFFVGIVLTLLCGTMLCCVDKCIGKKYNPKKGSQYIHLENVRAPVQEISGPQIITRAEPQAENINEYETSVPEVTSSPPASGLYVQDIDQTTFNAALKSGTDSSDSSDSETDESNSSNENEYNLTNENYNAAPLSKWEQNIDLASPDEDSRSESTASSISSIDPHLNLSEMGTELETSAVETEPVTSQAEETSVYSETETSSSESTSSESGSEEESTLPPTPPPPPKAEVLLSEEQKAAFREKLKMFQSQSSSGALV